MANIDTPMKKGLRIFSGSVASMLNAALLGAGAMLVFRCLSVADARRSLDLPVSQQTAVNPSLETLAELIREPRMQRLVLRGLSDAEVGRYLVQATGDAAPAARSIEIIFDRRHDADLLERRIALA